MRSVEEQPHEPDERDEWDRRAERDGAPDGPGRGRPATWRAALAVLGAVTALSAAACAGPPAGGTAGLKPLSQSHNNVLIVARPPVSGMEPVILVTNFLQALTGDQKDPTFSVAQEYLTDDARKARTAPGAAWETPTSIVKMTTPSEHPPGATEHVSRQPAAQDPQTAPLGTQTPVYVEATEVAELDQHGFYQAVAQPTAQSLKFVLVKEKAGWRINELPTQRVINLDSFKRVYQTNQSALPIYLPGSGDLAVDQVYLTQATGKPEYTYNALAEAVLHGRTPAQSSIVKLDPAKPVTLNAQGVATVTLKVPSGATAADLDAAQNALAKTFSAAAASPQLVGSTPPLQKVQVTYDGCTASVCAPHDVSAPVGGSSPTVYWACPEGTGPSTVVSRQPNPGSTTVCGDPGHTVVSVNEPLAKNSPIAVRQPTDLSQHKPQTVYVAVVVKKADGTGAVVVTDKRNPNEHVPWYTAPDATKVTDLEWDPVDSSLWVVDNHALIRVRDPGDKPAGVGNQDKVDIPSDARLTGFKPSPDGTRAVLVTDAAAFDNGSATPWPAAIVAIARSAGIPALQGPGVPLLADQTMGQPTSGVLARATDAAWADGRTVVLIGVSPNSNALGVFKVYSDGSQDSLISDPSDAQPAASHISAATSILNGRPTIWIFSDGAGPAGRDGAVSSNVYFKNRSGAEGYQDSGWSPVVATTSPDTGS
ncbi:MAG: hypothetical protein HOV87_09300 [Catenulispora sp.]|nr:hypothetical protein [Catenulispora sp.]